MLRRYFVLAWVAGVLFLFAYFGTMIVSFPIGFLFRSAEFTTARNITQMAATLVVVGFLVTGVIVAVTAALQPGGWGRKLLYVLPGFFLGVALVGLILNYLGVGTVGQIIPGLMGLTFAVAWAGVGSALAAIAIAIAASQMKLSAGMFRSAMLALGITGLPTLVAALGMLATVVIVSTTQPALPNFGPPGGGAGAQGGAGTQAAPGGQAVPKAQGAPGGQAAGGQAAPGGQGGAGGQAAPGGQGGQGGPGGPGGPGGGGGPFGPGGLAGIVRQYQIGGGLTVLFAVLSLIGIGLGLRALRTSAPTSESGGEATSIDYPREAGRALLAGFGVTALALVVIQVVPVSRTNPPVQTPIQWDSPQTELLAHRACMDCHSNETRWPWYASVAPISWLNTTHVHDAREGLNLSELNSMPAFRRAMVANNMATRIRMGTMPPSDYLSMHPEAHLTDAEKQQLIQGLQNSLPKQ